MLRFSANLGFLWPDRPLLERIAAAARAGFKAIELHWPYDTPASEVRERCEKHGIKLLGINTARGNLDAGEMGLGALAGREKEFQAAVDQSLAFSSEAHGTAVHCLAGKVPADQRSAARKVLIKNLREASDKAEAHGKFLMLEPLNHKDVPNYFYTRNAEARDVIEEAGRSNIKIMFDAYHTGMSGGDIIAELEEFHPLIGHIQIAAVPTRDEPDHGDFDYQLFYKTLKAMKHEGWIGAEYKPRADTDAGLGWMQSV